MLIYTRADQDPRIKQLTGEAAWLWVSTIITSAHHRRLEISVDEIRARTSPDVTVTFHALGELERNDLISLHGDGQVLVRAYLDLWKMDED